MLNKKDDQIKGDISLLPKISLTRPVTVLMTLLALLVVGFIAYKQIAVELMPEGFTPPFLGVWTPYPNANPEEVEQLIARPIEEVIRTIKGVSRINTYSHSNGCWSWIEFGQETDMDLAYAQLRDRMDRVRAELPDDIERLAIEHDDVRDCGCIGIADPNGVLGEIPLLCVVGDAELDVAALADHIRDRFAHDLPEIDVRPVRSLPRTDSGKLLRRHLRESLHP